MTRLLGTIGFKTTAVSPIGMDIGYGHVRMAQLSLSGERWTVTRLESWAKREEELGPDLPPGLIKRISRSLDGSGFQGRSVTAGLSVPDLEVHPVELDERTVIDAGSVTQALEWEMQRMISIAPDEAAFSSWRPPAGNTARTPVIGVAARRPKIEAISASIQALGLDCDRLDLTACALSRLVSVLRKRPGIDRRTVWGVLDAGRRVQRLVVCVNEVPVLVRLLGGGAESWVKALSESLEVSYQAAETHLTANGLGIEQEGDQTTGGDASGMGSVGPCSEIGSMIRGIIASDLDVVAAEIERSFEYVLRCYSDREVGELTLVGGGADLRGLSQYLAGKLGIGVVRLDEVLSGRQTVMGIEAPTRGSINPFAASIGLAMDPELFE